MFYVCVYIYILLFLTQMDLKSIKTVNICQTVLLKPFNK